MLVVVNQQDQKERCPRNFGDHAEKNTRSARMKFSRFQTILESFAIDTAKNEQRNHVKNGK